MADDKQESWEDRDKRLRADRRREHNTIAHDASPQAGDELVEGSDARKAKFKQAEAGKQEPKK